MGNILHIFKPRKPTLLETLELKTIIPYNLLLKHMNKLTMKYHPDRYPSETKYLEIQEAFTEIQKNPEIYSKEYFATIKGKYEFENEVKKVFENLNISMDFTNRSLFYRSFKTSNIEILKVISLIREKDRELNMVSTPSIYIPLTAKKTRKIKTKKPFYCDSCKRGYNLEKKLKEHLNTNKHKNTKKS